MGDQMAVDVALLPPVEIMEKVIGLIDSGPNPAIPLNAVNCLPHISLAMGVLLEKDINKVTEILKQITSNQQPLKLILNRIDTYIRNNGELIYGLAVKPNSTLTKLHTEIMAALRPLLNNDNVQASMFLFPEKVDKHSAKHVEDFYDKYSGRDFYPHVTLGFGKVKKLKESIQFTTNRLALARLGPYNSCRQILAETIIGQSI